MKKSVLTLAAIGSISALALVGCSGGGGNEAAPKIKPNTHPVAGEVPEGILKGTTLSFAADGGTTQASQIKAFFEPFAKRTGVKFSDDSPQTLAKIKAQVESGNIQWDFVSSWPDAIALECGTLFEKLDMSKIDTSNVPEDQLGGSECGVPSVVYGMVLTYDVDSFKGDKPQTWADFFDTKKFPGKRALYDGDGKIDGQTVQAGALAAGWDPAKEPFSMKWAKKGLAKINSIKDDVVFYNTGAAAQQMMENGEAKMGALWSGRSLAVAKNGKNVDVSWDHWLSAIDYFAIVKGTKNKEAAYYAINYTLGKAQQEKWTELSSYSPTNKTAEPKIDDLTRKFLTTVDNRGKTSVATDLKFWSNQDTVSKLQDQWSKIVAGG